MKKIVQPKRLFFILYDKSKSVTCQNGSGQLYKVCYSKTGEKMLKMLRNQKTGHFAYVETQYLTVKIKLQMSFS